MNRPYNLMAYDELDLKLGIKSSLPHVKGTLALSVLLWECADHPSELVFSEQKDKETVLTQELRQWLSDYLSEICEEENIDIQKVISYANDNQLFKSQMEALIVSFPSRLYIFRFYWSDTTGCCRRWSSKLSIYSRTVYQYFERCLSESNRRVYSSN